MLSNELIIEIFKDIQIHDPRKYPVHPHTMTPPSPDYLICTLYRPHYPTTITARIKVSQVRFHRLAPCSQDTELSWAQWSHVLPCPPSHPTPVFVSSWWLEYACPRSRCWHQLGLILGSDAWLVWVSRACVAVWQCKCVIFIIPRDLKDGLEIRK